MRRIAGVLACVMLLVAGCSTVPVTGRSQLNLMSEDQEMQLGLSSFEELKKTTPINRDPGINSMLQKVGRQIAQVCAKDMPKANWEFVLFESKEPNAFCLPGGKVGVNTGILPITKTEAGLATVIGHEVAHAVARHGGERVSHAMVSQGLGNLAGAYIGTTEYAKYQGVFMKVYGVGSQVLETLPHSREQESEADHIGLVYMARAGYDPAEAVAFWQRFAAHNNQQGGGKGFAFLRTHPLDEVRIRQLQEWLPEAQAEFARSQHK